MHEKRILIVEDEDDVIEFVSTVLKENGFVPVIARNGEEALDMIRQDRPDLVSQSHEFRGFANGGISSDAKKIVVQDVLDLLSGKKLAK